jgi:Na+/H+ antiporter NhaD/arsenite permease-like protein
MDLTLFIFLCVYIALGVGRLPGFLVDRTGAALVGAFAMLVAGSVTSQEAWDSIDYSVLGMLFGLMVVSAAFVVSGFYAWIGQRLAALDISPPALLAVLIVAGGGLSALLTNDVVVVAMTPLLVSVTIARRLNPVPFLLAFCFAANTGSVGLVMGSPQNIIVAQMLDLTFLGYVRVTALPALISLPVVWGVVAWLYRGRWKLAQVPASPGASATVEPVTLDRLETMKGAVILAAVIGIFVFTSAPRELVALGAAALLLVSRRVSSKDMLRQVDGDLLLLIMGLFVVNAALAKTGMPQTLLNEARGLGLDLDNPLTLYWVGGILSDLVSNNAAVMLLTPYLAHGAHAEALGAALAVGTGFSSNLIIFGSLAGIIVVEQAARHGITISFGEFARAGVPVTLACMVLGACWIIFLTGHL